MALSSENTANYPKRPGVWAMFFLQLFGMIGFSMIYSLITLYTSNMLGFSDDHSYAIVAAFNALAFATSVPGGWLAERYLGYRFGTALSIILSAIGLFLIAITNTVALYIGLGLFIMGTGMIIPCMYVLLGRIYQPNDPQREKGFMLAYIGMNVGSFAASAVSGSVSHMIGYGGAFIIGAFFTLVMLPLLFLYHHKFKARKEELVKKIAPTPSSRTKGVLLTLLGAGVTILLIDFANANNALLLVLGVVSLLWVAKVAFEEDKITRNKLLVFMALTALSVIFWTLYSLAPSALTIFTERNINREFWHIVIPTADLSSLNPLFIITLGPLLTMLWTRLKKRNIQLLAPTQFAIGTILMGAGYLILMPAIYFHEASGLVAIGWLVLSYFLQTAGELFVGPVGYAMVGQLVPTRRLGVMMGIWQLAAGIGGALSDFFARLTHSQQSVSNPLATDPNFSHAFGVYGSIALAIGLLAAICAPRFQKIIRTKRAPT